MKFAAGQLWPGGGHLCQRQCDVLDSHTSACVSLCMCVGSLSTPALFLIGTEIVHKNNVTWYVLGSVPQTVRRTTNTGSSRSGYVLTSRVTINIYMQCTCRFSISAGIHIKYDITAKKNTNLMLRCCGFAKKKNLLSVIWHDICTPSQ